MYILQARLGLDRNFLTQTGHCGRLGEDMVAPLGMQGLGLLKHMLRLEHHPRLD